MCYLLNLLYILWTREVKEQVFDEKKNTVTIKVVSDSPEKLKEKIMCKAGNCIKSIEIKSPTKPKPPECTWPIIQCGQPPCNCPGPCRRCCIKECSIGWPCSCSQCRPPPCPPHSWPTCPNTSCCGKPECSSYGCEKGCQSHNYGQCIMMWIESRL